MIAVSPNWMLNLGLRNWNRDNGKYGTEDRVVDHLQRFNCHGSFISGSIKMTRDNKLTFEVDSEHEGLIKYELRNTNLDLSKFEDKKVGLTGDATTTTGDKTTVFEVDEITIVEKSEPLLTQPIENHESIFLEHRLEATEDNGK